jgi:uncharacterized membrane protein
VVALPGYQLAFFTHVFSSIFLLIAGFTQFSRDLFRTYRSVHRWIGRGYVAIILLLAGPGGLVMSLFANGGLPSRLAFCSLSVLWMYTTFRAYQTARRRQFDLHGQFMLRSFALTCSALTLRIWKYAIVWAFRPPPMDVYMIVAWLGWVPNLLLAEWLIRQQVHKKIFR